MEAPVAEVASFADLAVSAAVSPKGRSDSKAGKAMQAPSPRKNWRRLTLIIRREPSFWTMPFFELIVCLVIYRADTSQHTSFTGFLKGGRMNYSVKEHGKPAIS